jgi:hypothetical protein
VLPHPFNHSSKLLSTPKIIKERKTADEPQSVVLSHMPPSFQRHFLQKATLPTQNNPLFSPSSTNSPDICSAYDVTPVKQCISSLMATPTRLVSPPTKLKASPPAMKTPKRCFSQSNVSSPTAKRPQSRMLARSLLFINPNKKIKGKENLREKELVETNEQDGVLDFLPKSILLSVRPFLFNLSQQTFSF